jgi:hypothetical protein
MCLSCMPYIDAPFLLYTRNNGIAFNTLIRATSRTIMAAESTRSGQTAFCSIKHHAMCYPKIHTLTSYCYTALAFRRRRRRLRVAGHSDAISQASLFIHVWGKKLLICGQPKKKKFCGFTRSWRLPSCTQLRRHRRIPPPPTTNLNFTDYPNTNYYDAKTNGSKMTAYTNQ